MKSRAGRPVFLFSDQAQFQRLQHRPWRHGHDRLRPRLAAERVSTVYHTLERPLVPVLVDMERNGIKVDRDGNYLVSQWEGRLYRIAPSGSVEKLIDTSTPGLNIADFEYVPDRDLVIIPTFLDDRIIAYGLAD